MEEIKNIVDRLLKGETVSLLINDERFADIRKAINEHGFELNWNHTRYDKNMIMFVNLPKKIPTNINQNMFENLPKKSDFRLSNEEVINKLSEVYVKEFNKWKETQIKESKIILAPKIKYNLIDDIHKSVIKNVFKSLGFSEDEIHIQGTTDTHNLWVVLKIF